MSETGKTEDYPHMTPPVPGGEEEEEDPEENREHRRSTYVIDRSFQYEFALRWLLMTAVYILILVGSFYYITEWVLVENEMAEVRSHILDYLQYAGLSLVLITLVFLMYFILLAHRIAGPAYRLRQSLDRMKRGEYDFTVSLREKDYLKNVAESMNETLSALQNRKESVEQIREDLEDALADMEKEVQPDSEIAQQLDSIRTDLQTLLESGDSEL